MQHTTNQLRKNPALRKPGELHPAWLAFIRHCEALGYGEISKIKVQDGIPVMAEETKRNIKFV